MPVKKHIDALEIMTDRMEKYLSKEGQEFLIGDQYTLADVYATVLCARICMKRERFMFGPKTIPYNPIFADKPKCK